MFGSDLSGTMTAVVEWKQHSEKSAVIVARLVYAQLCAMGCERFDPASGAPPVS